VEDDRGRRPELVALGNAVRDLRGDRRLTQDELAGAAGITARYLIEIELGRGNPSVEVLLAIAEALAVKASDLMLRAEADTSDRQ